MRKLNSSGAAAMMTVVFFALIITIVTTVYMRSIVSQVKNSLSYDLSTRAFYSAESGIQDAARALQDGTPSTLLTNGQDTCKTSSGNYLGGTGQFTSNSGYTCQLVDTTPQAVSGSLLPNTQMALMRLEPAASADPSSIYRIVIRWSKPENGGSSRPNASRTFSQLSSWNYYSVLRATVIDMPRSGTLNRGAITQKVIFLNPAAAAGSFGYAPIDKNTTQLQRDVIGDGRCFNSATAETQDYRCKITIALQNYNISSTGRQLYLQLGALYRSADFSAGLERCTSAGTNCVEIPLQGVQAEIDVTGKAGNTYRRVRQTIPISRGYSISSWIDGAIVAGEGICKNFDIGTGANQFNPVCDPTNP